MDNKKTNQYLYISTINKKYFGHFNPGFPFFRFSCCSRSVFYTDCILLPGGMIDETIRQILSVKSSGDLTVLSSKRRGKATVLLPRVFVSPSGRVIRKCPPFTADASETWKGQRAVGNIDFPAWARGYWVEEERGISQSICRTVILYFRTVKFRTFVL